jgi:PEP-CTERM motif-containing protein
MRLASALNMVQTLRSKLPTHNEVNMSKILGLSGAIFLTVFIDRPVRADMVSFDFDDIQSQSKKGPKAPDIEIYMERLFGSDISVSRSTTSAKAGSNAGLLQSPSAALGIDNGYLKVGKGRASGISFDFGANPIDSFSVDWLLRKGGRSFTILADGIVINQETLSKALRKSGLAGHQDSYFFDTPVHNLEFIGVKKKSFAIDNLVINIPLPTDQEEDLAGSNEGNQGDTDQTENDPDEDGNPSENSFTVGLDNPISGDNAGITQVAAAVPEPSSLLMLLIGVCGAWFSRKVAVVKPNA